MAIPVIVIAGFLGGGKTTFLQRLLPLCAQAGLRPALVINEAGAVDVDGTLLADSRAEMVSMLGGCICCTLQADLAMTVKALVERQAGEIIIIECSGLSAPKDVLAALTVPPVADLVAVMHTVCIVDSVKFQRLPAVVELVRSQIAAADMVVLNKVDKLDPARRDHVLQQIDVLRDPAAEVQWATYGDIGHAALLSLLLDPAPERTSCGCTAHDHCGHDHHHHHHAHALPAGFATVAVTLPSVMTRTELEAGLAALPDTVVRAKGFANIDGEGWVTVQRVFDVTEITPYALEREPSAAALVCIGPALTPGQVLMPIPAPVS